VGFWWVSTTAPRVESPFLTVYLVDGFVYGNSSQFSNGLVGFDASIVCSLVFDAERLYYWAVKDTPAPSASRVYVNIDEELLYVPFFSDFGPLNLGKVCDS
jgi:hypothetical protein